MSTGVINDTEDKVSVIEAVLNDKEFTYEYIEVNEGHS